MSPQNESSNPNRGEDHPAASSRVVNRRLEVNHDQVLDAKTLFEKVERFRTVTEVHTTVTSLYAIQSVLQLVASCSVIGVNFWYNTHTHIANVVSCNTDELIPVDHNFFRCFDPLAPFNKGALAFFNFLLLLYCLTCICTCLWLLAYTYAFKWLVYRAMKAVCKHSQREIPPTESDLTFLVQLLGQCNKLFIDRFSVFLDEKLKEDLQSFLDQHYHYLFPTHYKAWNVWDDEDGLRMF